MKNDEIINNLKDLSALITRIILYTDHGGKCHRLLGEASDIIDATLYEMTKEA